MNRSRCGAVWPKSVLRSAHGRILGAPLTTHSMTSSAANASDVYRRERDGRHLDRSDAAGHCTPKANEHPGGLRCGLLDLPPAFSVLYHEPMAKIADPILNRFRDALDKAYGDR